MENLGAPWLVCVLLGHAEEVNEIYDHMRRLSGLLRRSSMIFSLSDELCMFRCGASHRYAKHLFVPPSLGCLARLPKAFLVVAHVLARLVLTYLL